ncbi:MAG TPA: sulfatase-like hydrolase/transferase [Chitinophagales bacterium]
MKPFSPLFFLLFSTAVFAQNSQELNKQLTEKYLTEESKTTKDLKVVVVTYDGCRWQEIFRGADKKFEKRLRKDDKLDTAFVRKITTGSHEEKRKALSPFMWTTVAQNGIILGNSDAGNTLHLANPYLMSYPGYSELYSGYVNLKVNRNSFPENPNLNIFDALKTDSSFANSMVVFSNWDAFPKILNTYRNKIPMFCNYVSNDTINAATNTFGVSKFSTNYPHVSPFSEKDTTVYHSAKEYIVKKHPKATVISFDETDHFAHYGKLSSYIMAVYQCDQFMQDLWNTLQADSFYKDQTILVMTCDHGRGNAVGGGWKHHGKFLPASRNTWFAAIGPNVNAKGESKEVTIHYHNQIAATILQLLGKDYENPDHKVGKPIKEVIK